MYYVCSMTQRMRYQAQIEEFVASEEQKMQFPTTLSSQQRKIVHEVGVVIHSA